MDGKAWMLAVALGLVVIAAGCVGEDGGDLGAATASDQEEGNVTDTDQLPARVLEASFSGAPGFGADVACTFGGGPQLERTGEPVPDGAQRLVLDVTVEPGTAGLQIGRLFEADPPEHASETGSITWTPSQFQGSQTYEVDLGDRVEGPNTAAEWAFYYQVNPGVEEACFTGVTASQWAVTIDAVGSS